jgi:hypothetical protein
MVAEFASSVSCSSKVAAGKCTEPQRHSDARILILPAGCSRPENKPNSQSNSALLQKCRDIHGTELLRFCNMPDGTTGSEFCQAFIVGVRDGVVLATQLRGVKQIMDTPLEAKLDQLRAVVVKFLNDHPEEHHKAAALLVIFALGEAFPPQDKTVN